MRKLSQFVLLSALLAGGYAVAGRPVQQFEAPPEMTDEEKEALKKQQLGGNMNAYNKDIQIKETPVPWAAIGLGGLVLLVATPFALRAYRNTTKEIADSNTFGVSGGNAEDER
ncbi:MAG: hypothetical protein ACJ8AT_25885 [Hyalangium sp.]|uniref:hypothetical protein n=1 Tax=Hyalangium sp. TaxID=2028555 RepID=UPI00389A4B83